jgi:hypothetical protein
METATAPEFRHIRLIQSGYAKALGIDVEMFGPHALRATAATNALEHDCDIAKVQDGSGMGGTVYALAVSGNPFAFAY